MVDPDVDPAGVGGQVVDAVGDGGVALRAGEEAVILDLDRVAFRSPFTARVRELAEHLLLFRVHADDRLADFLMFHDLVVQVAELGVPVGVLLSFQGFGVRLQAETSRLQEPADCRRRYRVPLAGELFGEVS